MANVTDGCEEANFVGFSHEHGILNTAKKMGILWKNAMKLTFLQPSFMVAEVKISFAIMTHSCQAVIIGKFRSLLKIWNNQLIWQKKGPISFLILQNRFLESKILFKVP